MVGAVEKAIWVVAGSNTFSSPNFIAAAMS
jgi:hypothetical protein